MQKSVETVDGREIPLYVTGFSPSGFAQTMIDFGPGPLEQRDLIFKCSMFRPSPDRGEVYRRNADAHADFVHPGTSLAREIGTKRGKTALLVSAGPSSRFVKDCDTSGVDVWGLNLGIRIAGDALCGAFVFERLAKSIWWTGAKGCVEGQEPIDLPNIDSDRVMLVTSPIAAPSLVDHWGLSGNLRYAYTWECAYMGHDYRGLPALVSGGTTATTALHALVEMGYERIILAGSDFACMPCDGRIVFYGDGTSYEASGAGEPLAAVIGADGERWLQNLSLHDHSVAFEAVCLSAIGRGVDVVNASGGALPFPYVPLEEALKE